MKKFFVMMAMMLAAFTANAFEFDGIDLNMPYSKVAREISARGYAYNTQRNCLQGTCQGTEIFLNINYIDVSKKGMVGQLIVEIPMANATETIASATTLFNVIYHQTGKAADKTTYQVDPDGTQLIIAQQGSSIILTYNTPYYKVRKK